MLRYYNPKLKKNFPLGDIVVTVGVCSDLENFPDFEPFVAACLARHRSEDWGDVNISDSNLNDKSLEIGERLVSAYEIGKNLITKLNAPNVGDDSKPRFTEEKIFIITERDRSVTTILYPSEY